MKRILSALMAQGQVSNLKTIPFSDIQGVRLTLLLNERTTFDGWGNGGTTNEDIYF